jgi:hypothetical protein
MNLKKLNQIRRIVISRKSTLPVLDNMLIDPEHLYMTNLDLGVRLRHHFPVTEKVMINAGMFLKRVDNLRAP